MALSLQKGGNLSLSKEAPGLTKILVGLGWDPRSTDGTQFDLDASAFLLNASGKVRGDADFIFYNQLKSPDGSVEHTGDNRDGAGDGDDEAIKVDLSRVPVDVDKIAFTVTMKIVARTSVRSATPSSVSLTRPTAPRLFVTIWPKTPRLKPR